MIYDEKKVEALKRGIPKAQGICLDSMENDPFPIPSGSRGTVQFVDDAGQLIMKWDNGSSLSLIPGEDRFHVIQPEESQAEQLEESESITEEIQMDMSM